MFSILITICLGLILRTVPVWHQVFSPVGIKFSTVDSYYHALGIQNAHGWSLDPILLYNNAVALLGKIVAPEIALAIIPLILFALTVPAVYLIARQLFGTKSAMIASIAFAVIPGEYFGRSLLGDPDHHVVEVFVVAWAGLGIIKLLNMKRRLVGYIVLGSIITVMAYPASIYFRNLIQPYFSFLTSGYSTLTPEVRSIFVLPPASVAIFNFALTAFLLFVARHKVPWYFIAWTLLALVLTALQRRFEYYLIINLAILIGWYIPVLAKKPQKVLAYVLIFIIWTAPVSFMEAKIVDYRPSDEWVSNLTWLKTQPQGEVLAWGEYGYWVEYYSGMKALTTPGQSIEVSKSVASIFMAEDSPPLPTDVRYVIANSELVTQRIVSMAILAGLNPSDYVTYSSGQSPVESAFYKTLAARLYYGEPVEGYQYLYGDKVKIFEVLR